MCVALGRHGSGCASAFVAKAVLFTDVHQVSNGAAFDWALLVDATHRLVRVAPAERGTTDERLPEWIGRGHTDEGRVIGCIDVAAMLRELGGAP